MYTSPTLRRVGYFEKLYTFCDRHSRLQCVYRTYKSDVNIERSLVCFWASKRSSGQGEKFSYNTKASEQVYFSKYFIVPVSVLFMFLILGKSFKP